MALFEDLAVRYVTNLIRDFKLEDFQAAAIPGNGGHESGGFTKLQEINPTAGRGGLGHFQDTGPRRVAFEAWLAQNADKGWNAGTFEANYSFLFRELEGPEYKALAALKQTTTLEQATEVFMDKFERPGVEYFQSRIDYARRALDAFKASGIDAAALRAQGRPGGSTQEVISPPAPLQGVDAAKLQEILQLVLPAILSLLGGKLGVALPQPVPPVTPAPVVVTPPPAPAGNGSFDFRTAILGLVGSLGLSASGVMGAPVGPDATLTGMLVPLVITAASALGIPAPLARIGGSLISSLFAGIRTAAKPQ